MTALYALRVTEADHLANEFLHLGGAAWLTVAERDAAFAAIPEAPDESPTADRTWIVDVLDDWSIVRDRCISEDTAMSLLGVTPLDDLRDMARERNRAGERLAQELLRRGSTQQQD